MGEFFKEGKDLSAAEREFLQIFKDAEKPLKKELMSKFLRSFKEEYNRGKAQLNDPSKSLKTLKEDLGFHILNANQFMGYVFQRKSDKFTEAQMLGRALGIMLAVFEYGIVKVELDQEFYDYILKSASQWARTLKTLNKSIKLRFIKHRIETIAEKNVQHMTRRHEQLFVRVAAMFSS